MREKEEQGRRLRRRLRFLTKIEGGLLNTQ